MRVESMALLGSALGSCRAARRLLRSAGSLRGALETSGDELTACYGVRPGRARVWDALRRLREEAAGEGAVRGARLQDAEAVHALMAPLVASLRREVFYVLPLDSQLRLVCPPVAVARGGPDAVSLTPRQVFEVLFRAEAPSAVLVHNHPSGDPRPSAEDRRLTEDLARAGAGVGLRIVDHVIVASEGYFSLAAVGAVS